MRMILVSVLLSLLSFGLMVEDASAKRFGGGRSFGVQRSHSSLFSAQPIRSYTKQAPRRNWAGMLGGVLVGGLLASLFMSHGFGAGLLSWLLIGGFVFFIYNLLKRRMPHAVQSAQSSGFQQNNHNNNAQYFDAQSSPSYNAQGFDQENFLREAKVTFLRLQAAYDQNNKQDLSTFTAPEVFAEIEMQLNERGDAPNKTEVLDLKAEVLDVSKQVDSMIASVRFTGSVKENDDPMMPLDEIWHFRKFAGSNIWVVGGIQQEVINPR